MVREYIGARYVPKFTGAYDPTQAYEALSVVDNGMGTSYISKIPTPAGTPLNDTTYWTIYGASSGAIIDLQGRVTDLENNRSAITFDNYNALISADLSEGAIVTTLGYYAPNDSGGGTFIIVDTPSTNALLTYQLSNGKYAEILDDTVVLPRYGGVYVDEMVNNARNFIPYHNYVHVVLPPANPNHPACRSYTEGGIDNYFWVSNNPIVYDEHYAYTINDYYGNIMLDKDSYNTECVFKISDINKPEDIYFNTLAVEGWHVNGESNYPNAAVLIEGCARFNVQNFGAGYAANALLLGGSGANNTIEANFDFCEVGSCTENAIKCDNTKASILRINHLQIQNILTGCHHGINAINGAYKWNIGDMSVAVGAGQTITNFTPVYYHQETSASELGLTLGTLRSGSSGTGKLVEITGNRGVHTIGTICSPSAAEKISIDGVSTHLIINVLSQVSYNSTIELETLAVYAALIIDHCQSTISSQTGTNIIVNGICAASSGLQVTELNGQILDTSTGKLTIKYNGTSHAIN